MSVDERLPQIFGMRQLRACIPDHPLYRGAIVCGLAPLITGTGIFLLWLITRASVLMLLGILTIYAGIASVIVGVACLVGYAATANESKRRVCTACIAGLMMLLGNFPCAAVMAAVVVWIETTYWVTVVNEGSTAISDFTLEFPGRTVEFSQIAAGDRETRGIRCQGDGALQFRAMRDGNQISGTVEGYVTGNMGGDSRVVFHTDGSWNIERSFGTP